ncbi:hypothetical protein [Streptomyces sp. NPDC048527]|uniref:hypothetical protein n=1 Tax=Streptomyces sp. NPDC048527 TaxID=3365568 RepID=UPI00371278B7
MYAAGVGPSSHPMGPTRAARRFVSRRASHPTYTDSLAKVITTTRDTGRDEGHISGGRPWRPRRQRHRMLTP